MSYEEKLLNFIYKLYSMSGDSPAINESLKDQETDVVVELRIEDVPGVVWQIGSKNKKWIVNKGATDSPSAVLQYLKLKYLNDWWAGKMNSETLFSSGAMQIVEGSFDDLMFMAPVEEPLKVAYQKLKGEFPGLPE